MYQEKLGKEDIRGNCRPNYHSQMEPKRVGKLGKFQKNFVLYVLGGTKFTRVLSNRVLNN